MCNASSETSNCFSGAALPRLAMINSFAGFGRCSTTISLPVISAMQVQVCPVPTAILSNHLAFPKCHHVDYTPYVRDYINTWKELNISFDGLYCGFLGNGELVDIVEQFVADFKPPVFLLDPVMGDNGRKYASVTDAHCDALRRLAKHATLLTPNLYEACLLTGLEYHEIQEAFTQVQVHEGITKDVRFEDVRFENRNTENGRTVANAIDELFRELREICPGDIVISGIEQGDTLVNYILQGETLHTYAVQKAGAPHHGTGDLFASILIADALRGADLCASVKKAADFVALCIRGTESSRAPEIEGVLFEQFLGHLIHL